MRDGARRPAARPPSRGVRAGGGWPGRAVPVRRRVPCGGRVVLLPCWGVEHGTGLQDGTNEKRLLKRTFRTPRAPHVERGGATVRVVPASTTWCAVTELATVHCHVPPTLIELPPTVQRSTAGSRSTLSNPNRTATVDARVKPPQCSSYTVAYSTFKSRDPRGSRRTGSPSTCMISIQRMGKPRPDRKMTSSCEDPTRRQRLL